MARIARKLVDRTVPGPSTRWGPFVPYDLSALALESRSIALTHSRTCDLSNDNPWPLVPRVACTILLASSPPVSSRLASHSLAHSPNSTVAVNYSKRSLPSQS